MCKLHIITAVHNRYAITEAFVSGIENQTYKNCHLILVDDGSTDGTDQMVKNLLPGSTILHGDGNLWWGGALQKAYEYLCKNTENEDYVLIANDDTKYNTEFLETGVRLLDENENTLITACGYSSKDGRQIDGSVYYNFSTGAATILPPGSECNCASTRALFLRVKDFKAIGGFHPILLPHYGSDYEFTIRACKKGFEIKSFEQLKYEFNEDTTGFSGMTNLTLKKIFTKRSKINPFYRMTFIMMATPRKQLLTHLKNQIARYITKFSNRK